MAWAALLALGAALLLAPSFAAYDPRLAVGMPFESPGALHVLGTNDIGQDVLSQWLWAARTTLIVAMAVTAISSSLAWLLGILAGLGTGAEGSIVALSDLLLALPGLPLLVLVLTLLGPSQPNVVVVLGLLSWPAFARVVRSHVRVVRSAAYVEAARCLGASSSHIARTHILPATLVLLPANLVTIVRFAVFTETTLAFLGLGDPTPTSWGTMLGWAFANPLLFVTPAWTWLVLPPAGGIAFLVMCSLVVGGLSAAQPNRPGYPAVDRQRPFDTGVDTQEHAPHQDQRASERDERTRGRRGGRSSSAMIGGT